MMSQVCGYLLTVLLTMTVCSATSQADTAGHVTPAEGLWVRALVDKEHFVLGEPIRIKLVVTNMTDENRRLIILSEMEHRLDVTVDPARGVRRRWQYPARSQDQFSANGPTESITLAKAESWDIAIPLHRWYLITHPGTYRITLSSTLDGTEETLVRASVSVVVKPSTSAELYRLLKELDKKKAIKALSGFGQPEAIPYLQRHTTSADHSARMEAINGLRDLMNVEAVDQISRCVADEFQKRAVGAHAANALDSLRPEFYGVEAINRMSRALPLVAEDTRNVLQHALSQEYSDLPIWLSDLQKQGLHREAFLLAMDALHNLVPEEKWRAVDWIESTSRILWQKSCKEFMRARETVELKQSANELFSITGIGMLALDYQQGRIFDFRKNGPHNGGALILKKLDNSLWRAGHIDMVSRVMRQISSKSSREAIKLATTGNLDGAIAAMFGDVSSADDRAFIERALSSVKGSEEESFSAMRALRTRQGRFRDIAADLHKEYGSVPGASCLILTCARSEALISDKEEFFRWLALFAATGFDDLGEEVASEKLLHLGMELKQIHLFGFARSALGIVVRHSKSRVALEEALYEKAKLCLEEREWLVEGWDAVQELLDEAESFLGRLVEMAPLQHPRRIEFYRFALQYYNSWQLTDEAEHVRRLLSQEQAFADGP